MSEHSTVQKSETERTVEILTTYLRVIAQGAWNVGRGEMISVNEYAREVLEQTGLSGSPPAELWRRT